MIVFVRLMDVTAISEMGKNKKQNKPPPKTMSERFLKWKTDNPERYKMANLKQRFGIMEKRQVRFLSTIINKMTRNSRNASY